MTNTERDKLAAILGMCGSAHHGERAAAALHASRFLRERDLTWPDVLVGPETARHHEAAPPPRRKRRRAAPKPTPSFAAAYDYILFGLKHIEHVTAFEKAFLRGVAQVAAPSAKQLAILQQIAASLVQRGFA